jgi:hypothetical protein
MMAEHDRFDEQAEVIAAFADGKRVDTDALRAALATPDGRDYFIDLVALREVVRVPVITTTNAAGPGAPSRSSGARAWMAIASTLILCVLGGYLIGHRVADAEHRKSAISAPTPDRVIPLTWDEATKGK